MSLIVVAMAQGGYVSGVRLVSKTPYSSYTGNGQVAASVGAVAAGLVASQLMSYTNPGQGYMVGGTSSAQISYTIKLQVYWFQADGESGPPSTVFINHVDGQSASAVATVTGPPGYTYDVRASAAAGTSSCSAIWGGPGTNSQMGKVPLKKYTDQYNNRTWVFVANIPGGKIWRLTEDKMPSFSTVTSSANGSISISGPRFGSSVGTSMSVGALGANYFVSALASSPIRSTIN